MILDNQKEIENKQLEYMNLALEEARLGKGNVSPNPLVGCLIVKNEKIISKGAHLKYGEFHAERNAINNASEDLTGADLYVTLEPCNHYGKTPPCTEAIIKAGIKRVYIGSLDPNPLVAGKGIKKLRENNIEVITGILESECLKLNESFFHYITTEMPFVTYKTAASLDGCISTDNGQSKWISSTKSRTLVHQFRSEIDAVMIGSQTALTDNPSLTVRMCQGRNPLRIVIDKHLDLPLDLNLFTDEEKAKTYVITAQHNENTEKQEELLSRGVKIIYAPVKGENNNLDLTFALKELASLKITSILLEGGAGLAKSMFEERLINKFLLFQAPFLLGSRKHFCRLDNINEVSQGIKLKIEEIKKIDCDLLITSYPIYK